MRKNEVIGRLLAGLGAASSAVVGGLSALTSAGHRLEDANNHRAEGSGHYAAERYHDSVASYTRALQLYPDEPSTLYKRGLAYWKLVLYDQALEDFSRALTLLSEDEPRNLVFRAKIWAAMQNYERAFQEYEHRFRWVPDDKESLKARGLLYQDLNRYEDALADFNRLAMLHPRDSSAHYYCGRLLYALKYYEDAALSFSRAIEIQDANLAPSYYEALRYLRAQAHLQARLYDKAMSDYTSLKDSAYAAHHEFAHNFGYLLHNAHRYEDALRQYAVALAADNASVITLTNRGAIYYALGRYEVAIADYTAALAISPEFLLARTNRAVAYLRWGQRDAGLADLNVAQHNNPGNSTVQYTLACFRAADDDIDGSLEALESAVLADEKFRREARTDPDFENLRGNPRFREIVGDA